MRHLRQGMLLRVRLVILVSMIFVEEGALAQMPGSTGSLIPGLGSQPPTVKETEKTKGVAAPSGPIAVDQRISDRTLRAFLAKFLPKYPGIHKVEVEVDDGVATLRGLVDDDDSRDEITDVVRRVEGVRLVLNQLSTDEEVMTAWGFAARELNLIGGYFGRKWLLIIVAFVIIATSAIVARLFAANAEILLTPFVRNTLLRSVVGSLISSCLVVGGVLLALSALKLTQAVLSILGLAGVVGLAVGFAFRDITENFIASVLLGMRRPFQIGDYVTVAGQSGLVKSLNTRATVLVTLDGKHVRIPNSVVFKEIMVNATASSTFRNSFDVVIPNDASTAAAIDAIARTLDKQPGILADPPPRVLVEALETDGVRLRVYFWSPTQGIDWFQLMSDAKLRAKVALQESHSAALSANVEVANSVTQPHKANGAHGSDVLESIQARMNLDRDSRLVAETPSPVVGDGHDAPMDHVLEQPETRVSEEGTNLLKNTKAE